jgi:hypothetical protein
MYARLADLGRRALDRALDLVWDYTLPVSTKCPVCAFWRGVLLGWVSGLVVAWATR